MKKQSMFMAPYYGWRWTVSGLQSHYKEAVCFLKLSPRSSWYWFNQSRKDERMSWTWNCPAVLSPELLKWIQRPNHYVNWEDVCKCHVFISIKQTALKSSTRANIIGETFIFYALLTISPQDKVLKWLFYVGFLAGFFHVLLQNFPEQLSYRTPDGVCLFE